MSNLYYLSTEFRLASFFQALALSTFARGDTNIAVSSRIDEHVNPFLAQLQAHGVAKIYDLPDIGWTCFAESEEVGNELV